MTMSSEWLRNGVAGDSSIRATSKQPRDNHAYSMQCSEATIEVVAAAADVAL